MKIVTLLFYEKQVKAKKYNQIIKDWDKTYLPVECAHVFKSADLLKLLFYLS